MMKNKKLKWILLPVVLIVWGLIAYKIYKGLQPDPLLMPPKAKPSAYKQEEQETAAYALSLGYADPFLKNNRSFRPRTSSTGNKSSGSSAKTSRVKVTKKPIPLRWPALAYKGQIEKKGKAASLCILEVNRSLVFLSPGEAHEDLELLAVHKDSVQVEYKGREKKTLYLK